MTRIFNSGSKVAEKILAFFGGGGYATNEELELARQFHLKQFN